MNLTRRNFLKLSVASLIGGFIPKVASAFGTASLFQMTTLVYPGAWDKRKGAQSRISWEVMKRTSVESSLDISEIELSSPHLFKHPFLYMSGDSAFSEWPQENCDRLRRFLQYGGFLFIDGNPDLAGGFDKSVRREMARVFPDLSFKTIAKDHTLFKSFYLLDGRWGRLQKKTFVEGISKDGRTMVVYSQNDVGGAWMRDNFGNWLLPVVPGGEAQREMAFRFGVNLAMYSLCTNYKGDQVHIPFIMRRRRR